MRAAFWDSSGTRLTGQDKDTRDMKVLAHLARYPGLTGFEIARVLKLTRPLPDGRYGERPVADCLFRLAMARLVIWTEEPLALGAMGRHTWHRIWFARDPYGQAITRPIGSCSSLRGRTR
jgi:hypothetical protein